MTIFCSSERTLKSKTKSSLELMSTFRRNSKPSGCILFFFRHLLKENRKVLKEMGRIEYLYDYWLDISTDWPYLKDEFEFFQRMHENIPDYEAKAFKPEQYWPILRTIKGIGVFGSSICIIFNTILVIAILSAKDTRNMYFFPVVFQAIIDVLGPGIANIGYEIRSYKQLLDQIGLDDIDAWGSKIIQ